jgi:hypothetical protein
MTKYPSPKKLHSLGYGICKGGCEYSERWLVRRRVPWELWKAGDGVWRCPWCGYGIAPMEIKVEKPLTP